MVGGLHDCSLALWVAGLHDCSARTLSQDEETALQAAPTFVRGSRLQKGTDVYRQGSFARCVGPGLHPFNAKIEGIFQASPRPGPADGPILIQLRKLTGTRVDHQNHFACPHDNETDLPVRKLAEDTILLGPSALSHRIMVWHYCRFDGALLVRMEGQRPPTYMAACQLSPPNERPGVRHAKDNPFYIINEQYLHAAKYRGEES